MTTIDLPDDSASLLAAVQTVLSGVEGEHAGRAYDQVIDVGALGSDGQVVQHRPRRLGQLRQALRHALLSCSTPGPVAILSRSAEQLLEEPTRRGGSFDLRGLGPGAGPRRVERLRR
jgi:hypothetical protein